MVGPPAIRPHYSSHCEWGKNKINSYWSAGLIFGLFIVVYEAPLINGAITHMTKVYLKQLRMEMSVFKLEKNRKAKPSPG